MVNGIDSYSVQVDYTALSQGEEIGAGRQDIARLEQLRSAMGDTVDFSDEARALLETKLSEYKGMSPDELTDEQKQEIKEVVSEALGLSEEDLEAMEDTMEEAMDGERLSAGESGGKGEGMAQAGGPPPGGQGGPGGAAPA
ncbi:MAG: hypothetical protein D6E12_08655, partial [Desulfovibrio sp.]